MNLPITTLIGLLIVAAIAIVILILRLNKLSLEHRSLSQEHTEMKDRFRNIVDADAEAQRVLDEATARKEGLQAELDAVKERELGKLEAERTQLLDDIYRARGTHSQVLQDLQEQQRRSGVELEAIRARAREVENQALHDLKEKQAQGQVELRTLHTNIKQLRKEFEALDEEANLQSFGFYKPRYDFASSNQYQSKLDDIRELQKRMIKDKSAAICQIEWSVNGSRVEGRKQINQTLKLILRAFNGESDAAIAKVKYNNVVVMETRIRKALEAVNNLAGVQQCHIASAYLNLKLQELYLVHEYQEKLQAEKEEQRRIREEMREEELAIRELERAKQEAEREETRYAEALRKAREEADRAVGEKQQRLVGKIEELQRRLEEAQSNKERAIARAQMTRSGHVYVISNVGSFGEDVYKIGMTRRLDPLDRVRELGDASVPFLFDVHAIIYSEDAPTLETKLHREFQHRRVNMVNERKEFFRVSIDEIAAFVRRNHGDIEITLAAEAADYRKTLAMMQSSQVMLTTQAPSLTISSTTEELLDLPEETQNNMRA